MRLGRNRLGEEGETSPTTQTQAETKPLEENRPLNHVHERPPGNFSNHHPHVLLVPLNRRKR